jgi:hypothetical protein
MDFPVPRPQTGRPQLGMTHAKIIFIGFILKSNAHSFKKINILELSYRICFTFEVNFS